MKVLIVDDSIVFRTAIKNALLGSGDVREVDVASNGKIATEKLKQKAFDGITLDLEMPVMDGIETIKEIRSFDKNIPIIIFSAQNINAANKTIKALEMGANDFVQKIQESSDLETNLKNIQDELVPRFSALLNKMRAPAVNPTSDAVIPTTPTSSGNLDTRVVKPFSKANLICIGSSTGGPDFLMRLFSKIGKLSVPVLITQHMPPIFTAQLAKTLNELSPNTVVEAKDGDIIEPGTVYLAPGDYHMLMKPFEGGHKISLTQTEKVCFVRPAVDVMLNSVAECFSGNVVTYIFTGMGNDGANGCQRMRAKNGINIIQDEASSVVWGMPRAVYERNLHDEILMPDDIVRSINTFGIK